MDPTTYEQREILLDSLGPARQYLREGGTVKVLFFNGEEISASLPEEVELEVKQAAPSMSGETAAPQYKACVLETGAGCKVPTFVVAGDRVVVNTKTGDFVKRIK